MHHANWGFDYAQARLYASSLRYLKTIKKPLNCSRGLTYLAPRPGLEPGTYGLTVRRSTD